jgi:hypothetical protein
VMRAHEECAESPDSLQVGRSCRANVESSAQRSTIDICFSL